MNVEEYFEIYTGGNDYIATWTPKALKDFADEYHKSESQKSAIPIVSKSETWLCMDAGKNKKRCHKQCVFCE